MVDAQDGDPTTEPVDYAAQWEAQVDNMRETQAALVRSARRGGWFVVVGCLLWALNLGLLFVPPAFDWGWWASLVGVTIATWIIGSGAYQWGGMRSTIRFLRIFTDDKPKPDTPDA